MKTKKVKKTMPQKLSPVRRTAKSSAKAKNQSWLKRLFGGRYSKPATFVASFMVVGGITLYLVSAATTSYSFWNDSAVPKTLSVSDNKNVELGLKFKSSVAGYVTGVRFYKAAQNTGTHTGNLWDSQGRLLATVTFANETSSGWQTASFDTPVSIAANVLYVVSYHAPVGHYSLNPNYFKNTSRTTQDLTAPRNTSANPNGVRTYGTDSSTFPTAGNGGANYWVDVVFNTQLISPDPAPAAPSGLTANAQADGSVALNWQASVSYNAITNYTVYRDGNQLASVGTALSYADSTTQAGQTYSYQVQATDSTGQTSALSSPVSVTIPQDAGGGTPPTSTACIGTAQHVAGGPDGTGTCWPGPANTGVPAGTTLTDYTGSCTITTDNTIIEAKTVNCSLDIRAANVVIKNTKVNGNVILDTDITGSNVWSFKMEDSEVDAGQAQLSAVGWGNLTVIRSNIHGGQTAIQCEEKSVSCLVQDSYLHGQYIPNGQPWHLGGFLSDGGGNMTLTHNYVVCDHAVNDLDEGCTGDVNLIPNFATISGVLIQHNLMGANSDSAYCTYGGEKSTSKFPHADHVVYKDNVFQRGSNTKCAAYGPLTDFNPNGVGNQWVNNTWSDGTTINATDQ